MKLFLTAAAFAALSATGLHGEDTVLTYLMWDPSQLEVEQGAVAAFEAAHPGVTVEIQAISSKDYWPKLSAMAASGDLPDVFQMSSAFVEEWAGAGNLADLTDLVAGIDIDAYYPGAMSMGLVDGRQMAFPQNWVAPVLFYNKDMFDAAGVAYPAADWTWDDFRAAAKALTLDENGDGTPEQYGYSVFGRYAQVDPWVFRDGGRYLNADETTMALNPEALTTLKMLTDLVLVDGVAPKPQEMEGIRDQDLFPMGMVAMWVDGSWRIANNRDIAGDSFRWSIAQVPMGPDATPETARAYAWADLLAVGASSPHTDLAWAFIQHMVGPGRSASDFLGGKVPAYRAIAESDAWLERDQQPDNKALILEIGSQPTYTGFTRGWSAWRGYVAEGAGGMNGELDEVFNGRKSLDAAVAAFTAYANEVLSK